MNTKIKWLHTSLSCLLLAGLMIFPYNVKAQERPPKALELTGLAHAAIRVADLEKSRSFYQKLGFEEAFANSQNGLTSQSFIKINDRQFIELYPQRKPEEAIGFMHVCFESVEIEALNRIYLDQGLSPISVRRAAAGNLLFTMQGPEKQNIEYTQYMPSSRHTNDRGLHLGTNRISENIIAMGIEMQNTAAAVTYYREKLFFKPTAAILPGQTALELLGSSGQHIEIVQHKAGSAFEFFFTVGNLRQTQARLKSLKIVVERHGKTLWIQDPDGNRLIFIRANIA